MRVIITGGTGLVGRALTQALGARGDEVFVLSRDPHRVNDLPAGAQIRRWDGVSAQGWADVLTDDTAIVNLAGESIASGRWSSERKRQIRDSRINAGHAIVEAVAGATVKPTVLVQSSAVGYYGPRGHEDVSEEAGPGTDFLGQVCVDWENSSAAIEGAGVRRVIIRTGVVLSRAGGALPKLVLPFRLFVGGPLGAGQQEIPWIHLADEVGAIINLLDNEAARGPFNLAAPHPKTNTEFARVIGSVLGRPAFFPAPSFVFQATFGEMSAVLLSGQRAIPNRLVELGYRFRFSELRPALIDLLG